MGDEDKDCQSVGESIGRLSKAAEGLSKDDLPALARMHGWCESLALATKPEAAEACPATHQAVSDIGRTLEGLILGEADNPDQAIVSVIEADYAAYDMTVLTTSDPTPAGPYTTVYLGGDSDMLFGIADDINFYNSNQSDNCIVFAEAFAGLSNDLTAMGQALGNVISHEIGHDLGLMHTTDVTTLMDTTGEAGTLLVDQAFGTATVFDFPIGFQNAPLLLEESLGLSARARVVVEDGHLRCGTCGAKLHKLPQQSAADPSACGTSP